MNRETQDFIDEDQPSSSNRRTLCQNTFDNQPPINNSQTPTLNLLQEINIITHNIRGANQLVKMQEWIEHCVDENAHIISITETKLTDRNAIGLMNSIYKIYTSNFTPYTDRQHAASLGTALLVYEKLQPHIHDIKTIPGTAICIDFFFPKNNKMRIISVYLPTNHKQLCERTQTKVFEWYLEAKHHNWNIIILGDFNANLNRDKKFPLFVNLSNANATSLLDFHNITSPTWMAHRRRVKSMIYGVIKNSC